MDQTSSEKMVEKNLYTQLSLFVEFVCEEKPHPVEDVIDASVVLLRQLPSYHDAVLAFFGQLMHEYCFEYCLVNGNSCKDGSSITQSSVVLNRFLQALNSSEVQTKKNTAHDKSTDGNESLEDCIQSPTREIGLDYDMDDISIRSDVSVIIPLLDQQMGKISDILVYLQTNQSELKSSISITNWCLDLAAELSKKYTTMVGAQPSSNQEQSSQLDSRFLMSALGFWVQCSAMQTLMSAILANTTPDKAKSKSLVTRLLKHSPHSDWILTYLCTNVSQSANLTDYIEQLINSAASSFSTIFILSCVSEHNPQAIAKCSKSNLPLLLRLCTNSRPLLHLLAHDIENKVDVKSLNKLADSYPSEELNDYIIYCLLNAPNAFQLLRITFYVIGNEDTSSTLSNRALNLLTLVIDHIHKSFYETPTSVDTLPLISVLRDNIEQLISDPSIGRLLPLRRLQFRLLKLICVHSGPEFVGQLLHHLLNSSSTSIGPSNFESVKSHPLLVPLFTSLRLHFGHAMLDSIKDTLTLHHHKSIRFWASFLNLMEPHFTELDLGELILYLNQKSFVKSENLFKRFYILKLLAKQFDKRPKQYLREQYKLCLALLRCYFELIQEMTQCDSAHLVVLIMCIVTCQRLLVNLASKYPTNEYIISRYIFDFILEKSELFSQQYSLPHATPTWLNPVEYKELLNENLLKDGHNLKTKKNRLLPYNNNNRNKRCVANKCYQLNKQLLIDLLQSCIHDEAIFANNFIKSLSNDLILYDAPWLDEDPKDGQITHLRMTFEKDLLVSRVFEERPILWSIFEIMSKGKFLKHCLVMIRALINVQRANLASSTFREKNIILTQKIITLLANDEILPSKPFLYVAQLVPQIKSWDMSWVMHDISKYIRDCNFNTGVTVMVKPYLERLRIIMSRDHPGELYAKIFKDL